MANFIHNVPFGRDSLIRAAIAGALFALIPGGPALANNKPAPARPAPAAPRPMPAFRPAAPMMRPAPMANHAMGAGQMGGGRQMAGAGGANMMGAGRRAAPAGGMVRPHTGGASAKPGVHRAMATYPAAHSQMGGRPAEAGHARPGAGSLADRGRTAPHDAGRGAEARRGPEPGRSAEPGRGAAAGRQVARLDPSHDPRVGGHAATNTRGEARALPPPRPFLHAEAHRDPATDRALVARHAADFHSHNVRDFTPRERVVWQSGSWHNEWHYGRRGWWWEADGIWYPYALPIFPYPLEVADVVVYDTPFVDGPDLSYAEGVADEATAPPAGLPDIPPLPPAPPGWYRCDTPSGYYPDLAICTVTWVRLPDPPAPGEQ